MRRLRAGLALTFAMLVAPSSGCRKAPRPEGAQRVALAGSAMMPDAGPPLPAAVEGSLAVRARPIGLAIYLPTAAPPALGKSAQAPIAIDPPLTIPFVAGGFPRRSGWRAGRRVMRLSHADSPARARAAADGRGGLVALSRRARVH